MIERLPQFPELTFDDVPHIYQLNGQNIPSVTTLMQPMSSAYYGGIDTAVMEKAAGRGTAVHNAIENWIDYEIADIAPEYRGYFNGFLRWKQESGATIVGSECRVYHKILRYAGTADLPCIIGGKFILIDVKTTSALIEMLARVQLEAYSKAYESHGVAFDGKAILHLKRDGTYKVEPYPVRDSEAWSAFAALVTVNSYIQKYK